MQYKAQYNLSFAYNERSEVVSAQIGTSHFAHAYDYIGNQTNFVANSITNIYTHNALNQIATSLRASASLREICHDLDGNLTNDSIFAYSYDSENRLASVSSNSLTTGAVRVSNAYDYRNRRTAKTVQRYADGGWQTTEFRTFVYDGWNLIHETVSAVNGSTTNTTEIQYFWGMDLSETLQGTGGVGGLLAVSSNGSFYFPAYDNNGNVTKYIDESGSVVAAYEYDDFGRMISQSGSMADFFRIRFSTKYFDVETGLYYYGYRFYSPILMRWINMDPIEENGGINLYCFSENNALVYCDYLGMKVHITKTHIPTRNNIVFLSKSGVKRPRAVTVKTGSPSFYCDSSCRLHIDGTIKLSIEMLESSNPRWNEQYPQYTDNPFVSPELMVYSHELDHYNTWVAYLNILEQANAYDGKSYHNCKDVMYKFQAKHELLLSLIRLHSKDFDSQGFNQGLRYFDVPFDSSWFSWE